MGEVRISRATITAECQPWRAAEHGAQEAVSVSGEAAEMNIQERLLAAITLASHLGERRGRTAQTYGCLQGRCSFG
jgi:hypothetical protein